MFGAAIGGAIPVLGIGLRESFQEPLVRAEREIQREVLALGQVAFLHWGVCEPELGRLELVMTRLKADHFERSVRGAHEYPMDIFAVVIGGNLSARDRCSTRVLN